MGVCSHKCSCRCSHKCIYSSLYKLPQVCMYLSSIYQSLILLQKDESLICLLQRGKGKMHFIEVVEYCTLTFCLPFLFALVECEGGREYQPCGSHCPRTCDNLHSAIICLTLCSAGCFCPEGTVLHNDTCIPPSECPSTYDPFLVMLVAWTLNWCRIKPPWNV